MPQLTTKDVVRAKSIMESGVVSSDDLFFLLNQFLCRFYSDMDYAKKHPERKLIDLIDDYLHVSINGKLNVGDFSSLDSIISHLEGFNKSNPKLKYYVNGIWKRVVYEMKPYSFEAIIKTFT